MKAPSQYQFFKSISETKSNLLQEHPGSEKALRPIAVIWYLAHFSDCIMIANRVNAMKDDVPKDAAYEYMLGAIKKKKRYLKWPEKKEDDDRLAVVMEAYKYSDRVAREVIHLFSDEQIAELRTYLETKNAERIQAL